MINLYLIACVGGKMDPKKSIFTKFAILIVIFIFPALLLAETDYESKETNEKLPVVDTQANETKLNDKKNQKKAINFAKGNKINEAIEIAGQIEDEVLQKETMQEIGDIDASTFWAVWGAAFITNFDLGDKTPITSASIVNNVVRVEEESAVKYGLGLEVHRYLWGNSWGTTKYQPWSGAIAFGPYVSVLPSSNEIIDVIGAGIIIGFLGGRSFDSEGNRMSLNIAIGGYVDPDTRVLADGFEDGKAPPEGETTVRYSTVAQYGIQGLVSFSYKF